MTQSKRGHMLFHDVKLPKFMEVFATGVPEFSTLYASTVSGREARHCARQEALQKYQLKNCLLSELQFQEFGSFFRARKGRFYGFRFHDLADFKVERQVIATGSDGEARREIPLYKKYDDPVCPYFRRITKPLKGEIKLYLGGMEFESEIDYEKGVILLSRSLEIGEELIADFMFDVAVRFTSDSFEYKFRPDGSIEIADMELIEVAE